MFITRNFLGVDKMYWVFLMLAIGFEICGTISMKYTNGYAKLIPTIFVGVFYTISFYFMGIALKKISISTSYAVWSGLGTAAIVLVGVFLFNEKINFVEIGGITLIIIGVVMLNLATKI